MPSRAKRASPRFLAVISLAVAVLILSASNSATPNNSATELIRSSVSANTADWKAQLSYSYRERDDKSKIDSGGNVHAGQSRTVDVTMIAGTPYNRLIAVNGEPLNAAMQDAEQLKFEREVSRRRHESASQSGARISKFQNERSEEHLLMQQMTAAFIFSLKGEDNLNGIGCYMLDATPNPDYHPPLEKARVLSGMKGRLWITKADHHWAKVEADVISPVEFGYFIAKVKPGTSFELDQTPVEGVWLPKHFSQTVNASVLGLFGTRSKEEDTFSNYQKIAVSTAVSP